MVPEKEIVPHAAKESMSQILFEMIQKNKMNMLYRTCHMRPYIPAFTLAASASPCRWAGLMNK